MINKLRIIYDFVEEIENGLYIVGHNGLKGVINKKGIVIPIEYPKIEVAEKFIIAYIPTGISYASVFNKAGQRLLPECGKEYKLVEMISLSKWDNWGIYLLIRKSGYKEKIKLILLRNDGETREYTGIEQLPVRIAETELLAIIKSGIVTNTSGFEISINRCAEEIKNGADIEVIDKNFNKICINSEVVF